MGPLFNHEIQGNTQKVKKLVLFQSGFYKKGLSVEDAVR